MRVVFMGTPQLAATVLEKIAERHDMAGVFTRPDAVRARGRALVASPVRQAAENRGIRVFTPDTLKSDEVVSLVRELGPDVICVAAYGAILPKPLLDMPRFGCLNVHTSLLPRWRGAAPIERAILARDEQTGVCIMRMEEGLDTGPYCVRKTTPVQNKYLGELAGELALLGSEALLEALDQLEGGNVRWEPQAKEGLTYASKIEKGELDFDLADDAGTLAAKVRASSDSHPSRLLIAGRRVAVQRASVIADGQLAALAESLDAGTVAFRAKRLVIGTRDGMLEIGQVKPEGKKSMEGRAFAAGIQGIKNMQVTWGRA